MTTLLIIISGIGGGGLSVLLVLFNYGFGKGVVLSLWAVFGNILTQSILMRNAHHPLDKARPLVYWDIVFVLLPAKLFGSTIGVLLSSSAPSDILAIFAIFALSGVTLITSKKYIYSIELEKTAAAASDNEVRDISPSVNINRAILSVHTKSDQQQSAVYSPRSAQGVVGDVVNTSTLPIVVPWPVVGALCVTWACYALSFSLLTLVHKCSTNYIIIACCCYPALMVTMAARLLVLIRFDVSLNSLMYLYCTEALIYKHLSRI